jgi:hypothetical protein
MRMVYDYRLDDVIAHQDRIASARESKLRLAGLMNGTLLVALAVYLYVMLRALLPAILIGAAGVAMAALWVPLMRRFRRLAITRLYAGSGGASLFGRCVATATPLHLHLSQPNGVESTIPWRAVDRLEATDAHFWCYVSPVDAIIIPRASVSEGDFDAFVAFCREHVGRRAGS